MDTHSENDYAKFWIDNGILFCEYKPYSIITLPAAEQVVTDRLKLQGEQSLPVFCDIRGLTNTEKPAREYLAQEGCALCSAIAFLAEPGYTKELLNFYFATDKPGVPVSMFTKEQEAINYLKSYI